MIIMSGFKVRNKKIGNESGEDTMINKLLALVVSATILIGMGTMTFASEELSTSTNENVKVLQVLIVNDNGNFLYTGEEAQRVYENINGAENEAQSALENVIRNNEVYELLRSFSYKYRFVPGSNHGDKFYGSYTIISDPMGNATSRDQTSMFSFTATSAWSVNCSLTGKYKEVVEAAIGGDWSKEYSATHVVNFTVAPKKRVWLQYKPEYINHSGSSQKYYTPRYKDYPIIVESSQAVDIDEAYERTVTLAGEKLTLPAGVYVWCEDNDYLNKKSPKVQR